MKKTQCFPSCLEKKQFFTLSFSPLSLLYTHTEHFIPTLLVIKRGVRGCSQLTSES